MTKRIVIEVHGHQRYTKYEGVPIMWCQAVERYDESYKEVPAVLLRTKDGVRLVTLQGQHLWTEIKPWEREPFEFYFRRGPVSLLLTKKQVWVRLFGRGPCLLRTRLMFSEQERITRYLPLPFGWRARWLTPETYT